MKFSLRNLMAGLGTTLFLAACGGGGGGDDSPPPPAVKKPTAVATVSQTSVPIGTTVTFDGSGSTTPNGGSLSYQWDLPNKPSGSTAELSSATADKPSFTPDQPGDYVATLIVSDSTASSYGVRVTVTATNPDPVANIAPSTQGVLLGATVTLDGSISTPPTGVNASELSYQWTLTQRPDGDGTELQGADTATASFLASQIGLYKAKLKVRHGERSSEAEAEITVNASNSAPVIKINLPEGTEYDGNGSPIIKAVRGETVVLDGSGSHDPDGDALSYRWSFPSAIANSTLQVIPRGSNTTISNPNNAKAELVPDAVGTYYLDLTIYDASVATTQRVLVTASKPEGAANIAPEAFIGMGNPLEFELGGYVTLSSTSYDFDGDALTYQWTWWNTARPEDKKTSATPYVSLSRDMPAGTYVVELTVNDGHEDSNKVSENFEIKIGANTAPPVPGTKVDIARVLVGETITFDGSDSTDRNGDQIIYLWTLIDRPDGSNAIIQNVTSAQASVITDRPGQYTARLQVSDSKGAVAQGHTYDTVSAFAKAKNNPPVVAYFSPFGARNSVPAATDQPVILNDSGSTAYGSTVWIQAFDPDQDSPLYYIITPIQQPGSDLQPRSNSTSPGRLAEASLGTIKTLGDYEIEALVSDGVAKSEPLRQSFSVVNRADFPSLLLEYASDPTRHDASGPGGNPPSYSQLFFPSVVHQGFLPDRGGAILTFWYRLTAFDRDYTITDLVTSSTDKILLPSFRGLHNGQIIRKGESVEFVWHRPLLPNEAELPQKLREIGLQFGNSSKEYKNEVARQQKLLADYQFTGTFRIAEKENYTFRIGHFAQTNNKK